MAPFSRLVGKDEVKNAMSKVSQKFGIDENILSKKAVNKKPDPLQLLKMNQNKIDDISESSAEPQPVELKSFEVMLDK